MGKEEQLLKQILDILIDSLEVQKEIQYELEVIKAHVYEIKEAP